MRGWFNSGTNVATYTVNAASTWTTSSFTKGTNLLTTNSYDLYTIKWSANYLTFPEGSYMLVTFNSYLNLIDEYCYAYSGFTQGVNTNSNLVCKRFSSNQILISGYAAVASSTLLSISVYMQISDALTANGTTYGAYATVTVVSSAGNNIISQNTASYNIITTQRGSDLLSLSSTMNTPYTQGTTFPLYITFRLNTNNLLTGDYILVDFGSWVLDPATTGVQVFKYQLSGNTYWVPSSATLVSGNIYKVPVYNNYSMSAGTNILLWVDTFAPTNYYGAMVGSTQWNTFKIYAYKSGSLVEQNVYKIWTEPYGHVSLAVTPNLNYVGATTRYEFSVTPNISASAGDTILI
jgi:hypothetical protein